LGLFILIIGGFVSFFTKQEQVVILDKGEQKQILGNYILKMEAFSNSPNVWQSGQSKIVLLEDSKQLGPFTVSINNPFTYKQIKIYQYAWPRKQYLYLRDKTGAVYLIEPGEGFFMEDYYYLFQGFIEKDRQISIPYQALFDFWQQEQQPEELVVMQGDNIAAFEIYRLDIVTISALKVVIDYGIIIVYCSFFIVGAGIMLLVIQKINSIAPKSYN